MNAVGIDVSKSKSVVAIMRPFGEIVSTPFEIKHTASDIHSLIELINSVEGESRIVMEHTGRYSFSTHKINKDGEKCLINYTYLLQYIYG